MILWGNSFRVFFYIYVLNVIYLVFIQYYPGDREDKSFSNPLTQSNINLYYKQCFNLVPNRESPTMIHDTFPLFFQLILLHAFKP